VVYPPDVYLSTDAALDLGARSWAPCRVRVRDGALAGPAGRGLRESLYRGPAVGSSSAFAEIYRSGP
jgi:hypothetical protein